MINLLKREGPLDVCTIAGRFDLSTMAVRLHLKPLEADGIVTRLLEKRPVGRPAHLWELTPHANKLFPSYYEELAVDLVSTIADQFGQEGLDRVIQARTKRQLAAYRSLILPEQSLKKRLDALARIRTDQGYMAEVKPAAKGSFLLLEHHCPICAVAKRCTGLCKRELELFQNVLGPNASVSRQEYLLDGGKRCTYLVTEIGKARKTKTVRKS